MKELKFVVAVLCLVWAGASYAEFRVWSSKDGMSNVEARFIQMSGSKVVLEKPDGNRIMVPKNKLSAKDNEYLAGVIPPRIKIDVDEDSSRIKLSENNSWTDYEETFNLEVVIKKANREPCNQKFKAYLYMIAVKYTGDGRRVIASEENEFSFEQHDTTKLKATGKVQYENYVSTGKRGWKYEGYIVVIENEAGERIMADSSKSTYESKLNLIRENKSGDIFNL